MFQVPDGEWAALREDVGYIKAKVDTLTTAGLDQESRLRSLEKRWWQFPMTVVLAFFGITYH